MIDLQSVSKTYRGGIHALRGAALQVRRGEIFGLLGPNGAGKSTLVKILLSIVRATEGRGSMLGMPIGHKPTLAKVGYLPEAARFADYLTASQVLDLIGGLHRVPSARRVARGRRLLEMTGIAAWANKPLGSFSKGMKQRLGLAQALINDPDLVFLDEPTDGLDPVGRREVATLLKQLRQEGKTVFLNSHLLGEAERICDRVAILSQGSVVRQGTVAELTSEGQTHEIHVEGPIPEMPTVMELLGTLGGSYAYDEERNHTIITLSTARPQLMQPVIDELRRYGLTIDAILPKRQTLEDYFIGVVAPGVGGAGTMDEPKTIKS